LVALIVSLFEKHGVALQFGSGFGQHAFCLGELAA
jgi:hypothetical protein